MVARGHSPVDDNEADALALLYYGIGLNLNDKTRIRKKLLR